MNTTRIATCMGLLLAVAALTPAHAESRFANRRAMAADLPESIKTNTSLRPLIDRLNDDLVAQCEADRGGMVSKDGAYHCVDRKGNVLW